VDSLSHSLALYKLGPHAIPPNSSKSPLFPSHTSSTDPSLHYVPSHKFPVLLCRLSPGDPYGWGVRIYHKTDIRRDLDCRKNRGSEVVRDPLPPPSHIRRADESLLVTCRETKNIPSNAMGMIFVTERVYGHIEPYREHPAFYPSLLSVVVVHVRSSARATPR
jgi:hypothetical protein